MKKFYLITGCAGFVGFSVCLELVKKGKNIIGIDNLNNYYDVEIKKKKIVNFKKISKF